MREMLVETAWLAARLEAPGLRIVDAGHPEAYGRAHIPGAAHLEWTDLRVDDGSQRFKPGGHAAGGGTR